MSIVIHLTPTVSNSLKLTEQTLSVIVSNSDLFITSSLRIVDDRMVILKQVSTIT